MHHPRSAPPAGRLVEPGPSALSADGPVAPPARGITDPTINHRAALARKPEAAFLLASEDYRAVFGPEEADALGAWLSCSRPVLGGLDWRKYSAALAPVEAIVTGWHTPRLDSALLAALPALRIVFHAGGSVKFFVTDELWARGVRVTCAARANAVPVAEFTLAHVILGLKHTWQAARATRAARNFVRNDGAVPSAYGSTVGILSLGLIGRLVAERLRSLDLRIIAYDPLVSVADAARLGVELCPLDEIFSRADVVTCHTPLLPETKNLIRAGHFAAMKTGATFINTARGAVVHEDEMISVLTRRSDLYAVLDVTDPEPPLVDSPLYTMPNVLLTPHISGSVGPECRRMGRMIADEARRYVAGEPLLGEVRREQLAQLA